MLVFDLEQIALKRKQSHVAKVIALAFGLCALGTAFAGSFFSSPAVQFGLAVVLFFCLIGVGLTFSWSLATDRMYGVLTDKAAQAQLILVRRHSPEVDRALYAIERQGRGACRGEAAALLSKA